MQAFSTTPGNYEIEGPYPYFLDSPLGAKWDKIGPFVYFSFVLSGRPMGNGRSRRPTNVSSLLTKTSLPSGRRVRVLSRRLRVSV